MPIYRQRTTIIFNLRIQKQHQMTMPSFQCNFTKADKGDFEFGFIRKIILRKTTFKYKNKKFCVSVVLLLVKVWTVRVIKPAAGIGPEFGRNLVFVHEIVRTLSNNNNKNNNNNNKNTSWQTNQMCNRN